ncbi:unnamed protein product [Linum tenue]|uniref:Uncharacterized protein n=1 Tax=Linum tenue TaxID=586396 RepID=A0AAV0NMF8_9ROSI|nr:unnamed protein product [Linum tenue]
MFPPPIAKPPPPTSSLSSDDPLPPLPSQFSTDYPRWRRPPADLLRNSGVVFWSFCVRESLFTPRPPNSTSPT